MQDPLQPARRGPSRRTRPSLASMPDSGFQPSRPQTQDNSRNSTFPRSFSLFRNNNVLEEHPPDADVFDLGVTSQLLESPTRDAETTIRGSRSHTMRSMRSFRFPLGGDGSVKSTSGSQSLSPNSISRSQTISSAWSGMSNRLFTDSAVGTVSEKPTADELFSSQFNKLARKHGIQSFPDNYKAEPAGSVSVSSASNANNSSGDSTPVMHGNRLWNKLLGRKPSSIDISKSYGNMKLSLGRRRGSSIGDLAAIGRGKRDSLKGMHLEDMIRLGGVSPFTLPEGLSPGDLLIPTCMHASASYILTHGLKTPGLFRVAGNLNTTYSLYDYYQRQFEENNNEAVVQTIALAKLPTSIKFHVHDVAHLFKKLLHGLPGGLLGSPAVFQALYNVHSFVYPDPSLGEQMSRKVKPRMIALAIASINLHFRISLICAVFGLLRAVSLASEQEQESKLKDPHTLFEAMKEDALGIIFGPLLLGDKSEQILLQETDDRGGLLVLPKISPVPDISSKRGRYSYRHSSAFNKMQNEKTKRAAVVCDMLINNWEEISYQLKKIDALNITAQAYDLPSLKQELPEENQEERLLSQSIRATKTASMRSRRGVSTIRSRIASDDESILPFQGLNPPSFHKPPPQVGDLMKFSTHDTLKEDDETPYLGAPPYLSMPMSTVPEASSPNRSPTRSPTRSIGAKSTPGSPNWVAHNPETPIQTPIRRPNFSVKPSQLRQVADYDPVTPSSASSSSDSSGASSPGLEVAAQAATRLQRAFLGGQTRMGSDNTIIASEMLPEKPRVPSETPTEIPDFEFTPTNFRDFDLGEFSLSPDPETTPKPLNIKNKVPKTRAIPAFSIFEDKTKCKSPVLANPMLTLTRPNARSEVKLTHKASKSMSKAPIRPPTRRNPSESSSRPTTAPLQPAAPNLHLRGISIDSDFEDRYVWREDHAEAPSPTKKRGNSALHIEIRRLQRLLDVKTEEAAQAKKDLELAQNVANAGALSHMLREAQEEVKVWKNRAEWAEKQLRTKGIVESRRGVEGPRAMGVPKKSSMRYSLG